MQLFNHGKFKLHSGRKSNFKIDCDALTDADIQALAKMVGDSSHLKFKEVVGIPRGGLRFAEALKPYVRKRGSILIVDDVLTSGMSMQEYRGHYEDHEDVHGLVIFSRGINPAWVTSIFHLNIL